jgi:endonuclease/exonuclease/phosphatase family metal-dependent hydrolase
VPGQEGIVLTVLSWNLFHGRDFPPGPARRRWRDRLRSRRPLFEEFAGWLERTQWSIALLQEAPPRWFPALAQRAGAHGAIALTSRNLGAWARRWLADLNPDLIASNEGGSNQLLVRPPGRIREVRRLTLTRFPERRRMLFARLELDARRSLCVANLHASANRPRAASAEVERAAEAAARWAGAHPLVFGGDFNVRPLSAPELFERLRERFGLAAPTSADAIDHLLVRGLDPVERPAPLPPGRREVPAPDGARIRLSDHAPVLAAFGMK